MSRLPYQIGVFPYRQTAEHRHEYLIFHRSDEDYWQCIAGGGEDAEIPLQAAQREAFEEAAIASSCPYIRLDTTASAQVTDFLDAHLWGSHLLVIPIHYFGVRAEACDICLSHEHLECRWLDYEAVQVLLKWDGDKTALWELEQRLKRGETPTL